MAGSRAILPVGALGKGLAMFANSGDIESHWIASPPRCDMIAKQTMNSVLYLTVSTEGQSPYEVNVRRPVATIGRGSQADIVIDDQRAGA